MLSQMAISGRTNHFCKQVTKGNAIILQFRGLISVPTDPQSHELFVIHFVFCSNIVNHWSPCRFQLW